MQRMALAELAGGGGRPGANATLIISAVTSKRRMSVAEYCAFVAGVNVGAQAVEKAVRPLVQSATATDTMVFVVTGFQPPG